MTMPFLYAVTFVLSYLVYGWFLERSIKKHGFWSKGNFKFMFISNVVSAFIFYALPYIAKGFLVCQS